MDGQSGKGNIKTRVSGWFAAINAAIMPRSCIALYWVDSWQARRVLCHPQPDGKPCPRCVEKGNMFVLFHEAGEKNRLSHHIILSSDAQQHCIRGRPRKNVQSVTPETPTSLAQEFAFSEQLGKNASASSSMVLLSPQLHEDIPDCPDLTPELVAHFFEYAARHQPPHRRHPSIRTAIREISFQLSLLPPQSRVLALCIIAFSSSSPSMKWSSAQGPSQTLSPTRCSSTPDPERCCAAVARDARQCGRALHAAALKAAWEAGVMLQVTTENAASCYMLEMLEQSNFSGLSRPWASAYLSHVRALAPIWRASTTTSAPLDSTRWAGFLTNSSFAAQRLFPPEEFLASLEAEASSNKPKAEVVFQAMKPYLFNIIRLARQLWATIAGDHLPPGPPSESAALQFLSSLSIIHTVLSHLLTRAEVVLAALAATTNPSDAITRSLSTTPPAKRASARGVRAREGDTLPRGGALRSGATPTLCDYARFALDEAEAAAVVEPERVRDIKTISDQLQISGYSQDLFSDPETVSLVERLDRYLEAVNAPPVNMQFAPDDLGPVGVLDPDTSRMLEDLLLPFDQASATWMDPLSTEVLGR
ncbi:hypothetical protein B0H14DRAFT_3653908 [Mycena olivaceomarginata]|nr:hypothetical protein B0H14DRAFT_3653908 [Mycena olivaceomarginata]